MKRISFNENDAGHLYELALEHFQPKCYTCNKIKGRLEKFIGKKEVDDKTKIIKRNGYCNKLKKINLC